MSWSFKKNATLGVRRHKALNPVTGLAEAFIAMDGPKREWSLGGPQAITLTSATNPSTTEASPDGLSNGKLIQNTTATNTHGINFNTGQAITTGNRLVMAFAAKAGTLTKIKVYFGTVATTPVVATFDLSNGTKVSGDSRLKIRPLLAQDAVVSGFYEIYSVGVTRDTNINTSDVTIRALKASNDAENYTGTTAENWTFWKYGIAWDDNAPTTAGATRGLGYIYDCPVANPNTSTKVSSTETFILPLGATLETPQAMSVYMEWLDRGNAISGITSPAPPTIFWIGDMDANTSASLKVVQTSTGFEGTYTNAAGTSTCNISLVPTDGQLVGLLAVLDADGALTLSAFVNEETAVVGTTGTGRAFATPWSGNTMTINTLAGANVGEMYLRKCNLYSGVADLATLRAA